MPAWDDDYGISVVRLPDQFYVNLKGILDYNLIFWINIDSGIVILPIFICLQMPVELTPEKPKKLLFSEPFLLLQRVEDHIIFPLAIQS